MKQLTLVLLFLISSAYAAQAPKWPNPTWEKKDPEQAGFSYLKLFELEKFVFAKKQPYKSNALVIIKNGKLIYEKYANGYSYKTPHRLWSVSKSISSAITGAAIKDGFINLKDHVGSSYPMLGRDEKTKKLTVKDLLQMSSGLEWNEGYESNMFSSDIIKVLYGSEKHDAANYVSTRTPKCYPGNCFAYSSGDTNLLMGHIKKTMGQQKYDLYPWTNFFFKIGIHSATWEQDTSGTFIGSSFMYMTPRDLAKFGLLYLNKGNTYKENIIPQRYVDWSLQVAPSIKRTTLKGPANQWTYGAGWWLNRDVPEKKVTRTYPDAPNTAFFGLGHHGQVLAVIPNHNLIIVRHGADKEGKFDTNKMIALAIEAMTRDSVKK